MIQDYELLVTPPASWSLKDTRQLTYSERKHWVAYFQAVRERMRPNG